MMAPSKFPNIQASLEGVGICVWNFLMQKEENGILPGGLREEVSMITVHAYIRGK